MIGFAACSQACAAALTGGRTLKIGSRIVGPEQRPFIIAEVAQSHEGSLGMAFSFIDVARECGADAVKFQTHIASEESTRAEPWRIPFSQQDECRYDYWKRMEFSFGQWRALKEHADKRGILFLSSPFSVKACDWLEEIGVPAWKIASGEARHDPLLQRILASGKPVLLSTGLSTTEEAFATAQRIHQAGTDVALLHCTTRYPTAPEEVGLNVLESFLRDCHRFPAGLSDHSGTPYPGIVAAYLGASVIEAHLTLHPKMFGPDVSSSLTPEAFETLVRGAAFAWAMRRSPVDKQRQLMALEKESLMFGRSLVTARPIASGERIGAESVAYKKPGGGMPFEQRHAVVGRISCKDLPADHRLSPDDVR